MDKAEFEKYLKYMDYSAEHYGAFEYENIQLEDDGKISGEIMGTRVDISNTYQDMLESRKRQKEHEDRIKPLKERLAAIEKEKLDWM